MICNASILLEPVGPTNNKCDSERESIRHIDAVVSKIDSVITVSKAISSVSVMNVQMITRNIKTPRTKKTLKNERHLLQMVMFRLMISVQSFCDVYCNAVDWLPFGTKKYTDSSMSNNRRLALFKIASKRFWCSSLVSRLRNMHFVSL